jgi:hypothetical protein
MRTISLGLASRLLGSSRAAADNRGMPRPFDTVAMPKRGMGLAACLVSLAAHLALAIAGVLLVRGERTRNVDEADRPLTIIVSRSAAAQLDDFAAELATIVHVTPGFELAAVATPAPVNNSPEISPPLAEDTPQPLVADLSLLPIAEVSPPKYSREPAASEAASKTRTTGKPRRVRIPGNVDEAAIYAEEALIRREEPPTGPTADLSLFGGPSAAGRSFVFVIDRSASMGSSGLGAIQAAAEELAAQLQQLTDKQTFQVVAYNQSAAYFTDRELIPATSDNQKQLVRFVSDLAAYGETEHLRGLIAAFRLKPEVIYLFTDGDPQLNLSDLRLIREQTAGRTSIHCLHFGRGRPTGSQHSFERLADENRGSYLYVDLNQR